MIDKPPYQRNIKILDNSHYQELEADVPEKASSRFKSPANLQSATTNQMNIFKDYSQS